MLPQLKYLGVFLVLGLLCACNATVQAQLAPEWGWATAIPSLAVGDGVIPRAIDVNEQEQVTVGGTFATGLVLGPDTILNTTPQPLPFNLFYAFQATYNSQGVYQFGMHSAIKKIILDLAHDGLGNSYSLAYAYDSVGTEFLELTKYNPISGILANRQLPYDNLTLNGFALAVTPAGVAYVTATMFDTVSWGSNTLVSAGFEDIFLAKFSPQLQLEWVKQAGGSKSDKGTALGIAPGGGCYLTGEFQDTAQVGGQLLISSSGSGMFVAHYSTQGNLEWVNTASADNFHQVEPMSLAVSANGNLLISGYIYGGAIFGADTLISQGMEDVFISAWSAQGQQLWAKSGGTTMYDYPREIVTDSLNNAYLLFNAAGPGFVYNGVPMAGAQAEADYLLKTNSIGEPVWVKRIGDSASTGTVQSRRLAVTPGGKSFITGNYYGSAVFGAIVLPVSPGMAVNGFVASLDAIVVGLEPGITKQKLQLYPNPASGAVTVVLPELSQQPVQVQLRSLTGQVVFDGLFPGSQDQINLTLPALPAGLYLVSVAGQHYSLIGKLVLE